MTRVAIVGGGAAGLLAGIAAAWGGAQVTIYEKCVCRARKCSSQARDAATLPTLAKSPIS